jgi:GT2 family glycosyltransferase
MPTPVRVPARVLDLEIGQPLPPLEPSATTGGEAHRAAYALVRLHGCPLGTIEVDLTGGPVMPDRVAAAIWTALAPAIAGHLAADGAPPLDRLDAGGVPGGAAGPCTAADEASLPFTSVVISTHERPGPLVACVDSVLRVDYPRLEVLVVDNAPKTTATRDLIEARYAAEPRVRYLLEPAPGASNGRNCGLRAATGEVVAFLDDDVVVDRLWLRSLVLGFRAAPGVACVTGMILPAELETPAQMWIEEFGGFDKGYERQIFDLAEHAGADPLYPYAVGTFGSGASSAFDPAVLRSIGGFDTALGPATPARGGEDIDAFLQIILAGHRLVYEPRSLVRHQHRREYADLRKTVQGYGVGLAAVLTKAFMNRATRADILRRVPRGVVYFLNPSSPKNQKKTRTFPRELTLLELSGVLIGPWCYLRSRRLARSTGQQPRGVRSLPPSDGGPGRGSAPGQGSAPAPAAPPGGDRLPGSTRPDTTASPDVRAS